MKISYSVYGETAPEIRALAPGPAEDFFAGSTLAPIRVEITDIRPHLRHGGGAVKLWEATVTAWTVDADA